MVGSEKRTCTGCEKEETRVIEKIAHSLEQKHDETNHWDECTVCGDNVNVTTHKFKQKHDDTKHWDECVCGEKQNITTHNYDAEWSSDETNHWHGCVCGEKQNITAHAYVKNVCTICDFHYYTQGLTYSQNDDGSFSVSGIGMVTDTDIYIPSKYNGKAVTRIGEMAFKGCSSITGITIPSSVTSIGSSAFRGCSSLTDITIPSSVTSIGSSAFEGCSSLTGITIPNSVTGIGDDAFKDCYSLTRVDISDIAAWCKISFGNYDANPLSYVHNLYLNGTLVTEVVIPDGVTSICSYAFSGCSSLVSITIPDSVTSIDSNAFKGCRNLTSITIPSSLTSIGDDAFKGCSSLVNVTIDSASVASNVTSSSSAGYLVYYSKTIYIKSGITTVGSYITTNYTVVTTDKDGYVKYVKK